VISTVAFSIAHPHIHDANVDRTTFDPARFTGYGSCNISTFVNVRSVNGSQLTWIIDETSASWRTCSRDVDGRRKLTSIELHGNGISTWHMAFPTQQRTTGCPAVYVISAGVKQPEDGRRRTATLQ